jgi:hypothetical protein
MEGASAVLFALISIAGNAQIEMLLTASGFSVIPSLPPTDKTSAVAFDLNQELETRNEKLFHHRSPSTVNNCPNSRA